MRIEDLEKILELDKEVFAALPEEVRKHVDVQDKTLLDFIRRLIEESETIQLGELQLKHENLEKQFLELNEDYKELENRYAEQGENLVALGKFKSILRQILELDK